MGVSTHTFKYRFFTALCVINPHNAFFISCCEDVLQLPRCRKKEKEGLVSLINPLSLMCVFVVGEMQISYQKRKLVQMVVRIHPGCHRKCAHHGEHTGSLLAGSSEGIWARDLQEGLWR